MRRRGSTGIRTVLAVLVLALAGCGRGEESSEPAAPPTGATKAPARAAAERPNVIVYLIDTLRADHLGVYGYDLPTSPNIDALATESILFTRAHAQSSWTRASVGSLFTGLFPSRHGAVERSTRLREDAPTLAEILREQGYSTAAFLANPNVLPAFGFGRGFDEVFDIKTLHGHDRAEAVHASVFDVLERIDEPFFLYVHTMDPHMPYMPPPPYRSRFVRPRDPSVRSGIAGALARYDGEIGYADHELGQLLDRLRETDLFDDTVFVLLSDHGEEFDDHGDQAHGRTLYAEQLEVPLIVRLPRGAHGGSVVREPVRVIDVLPSLVDHLGLPALDGLDGSSFMPLVSGEPDPARRPLFAELNLDRHIVTSLQSGDKKIILRRRPLKRAGTQLFDLAEDPDEQRDVSSAEPESTRRLQEELDRLESSLAHGTFVELHSFGDEHERHALEVVLTAIEGHFVGIEPRQLEADDQLRVDPSRQRIELSLQLENRLNRTGTRPPILVDSDGLRFEVEPRDSRWTIEIRRGDSALARYAFRLGRALELRTLHLPLALPDPSGRIQVSRAGFRRQEGARRPYVHVYQVAPPSTRIEIEAELDERLRALGYVGED